MKKIAGFTLVELLVAIAIFAVLSALGWKVFDYLLKVKERNAIHEQNLSQLQQAYQQILRDSVQIVPVTANIAGQRQSAFKLDRQSLSFSKAGVSDPLQQGLSPFERIEYQYRADEKKLYRLKYRNLNTVDQSQPLSSVLLNEVDQFQVTVLNPNETAQWPGAGSDATDITQLQTLPRGFKVKLTIQEVEYEWIYTLLNTEFLKPASTQTLGPGL